MNVDLRACFGALPRNLRLHWMALLPILSLMAVMEMVAAVVVYRLVGGFSTAAGSGRNLVLLAAAVFVLRSLCAGVVATLQVRVVARSMQTAFASLVEGVLRDGLTASSSAVIQDAASGVDIVYRRVFGSAAMMVAEGVTIVAIGAVLVAKAPGAALLLLAITGAAVFVLIALTRRVAYRTGDEQYQSEQDRVAGLLEIIGGMREIRAFGLDARFRGASEQIAERHHRAFVRYGLLASMPRIAIEMLFVLTALAMTALLMATRAGANDLPALALFAYAAFRLIPSVNRILFLTEEVRHGRRAATSLSSSLRARAVPAPLAVPDRDDVFVELRDVSVFFGDKAALQHIDFQLSRGEAVAVTGLSGAGKTTLLDVIAGAIPPGAGELRRAGARIAYLAQRPFLFEGSIRENIALHSGDVDEERLRRVVEAAQLAEGRALTDSADSLSEGERQRVGLARALYAEPQLLLLDEPTSALDTAAEQGVIVALRNFMASGGTLIVTSHQRELISICSRVVAIEHGSMSEQAVQPQRISAV